MKTKELIEKLNAGTSVEYLNEDGGYDTDTESVMAGAANRLSEQQKIIDDLVDALEEVLDDFDKSGFRLYARQLGELISRAKGDNED